MAYKTPCPRCKKIITTTTEQCPECGFSMEEYLHPDVEDTTIIVNGVTKNIPHLYQALKEYKAGIIDKNKFLQHAIYVPINWQRELQLSNDGVYSFSQYIENNLSIPKTIHLQTKAEEEQEKLIPKCPKCGSTHIEAVKRGWSPLSGLFGSGKTMNYCKTCGHQWRPHL